MRSNMYRLSEVLIGSIEGFGSALACSMLAFLLVEGFLVVTRGNDDVDRFSFSVLMFVVTWGIFSTGRALACALFAIGMFAITMLNALN